MEFAIIILYAGSKIIQDKQAQSILFLNIEFTYTFFKIYYHRYNINHDKLKFGIPVTDDDQIRCHYSWQACGVF